MMTRRARVSVAMAAVALLGGCGDSVVEQAGGSGGQGGSGGSGGQGGQSACAVFDDEPGAGALTVRFRNESGVPIYLPADCAGVEVPITHHPAGGGPDELFHAGSDGCLQSCEDLQHEAPVYCGPCAPTTILLPPGGTHEVGWDGTGTRWRQDMPASCWAGGQDGGGCSQVVTAPSGSYGIDAVGYDSCSGGDCQCTPDGICNGTATGMQAYASSGPFVFPDSSSVEVVFGPCAFPCPS